jgi:alpha-ketoglutarate-dependent taurine dioxygenase
VSLPITARQLEALRALQQANPDLGALASGVALAFDASKIDNPQLARLVLEKTCRRVLTGQPGSREALVQHLENFAALGCLSRSQAREFSARIHKLA